MPASKTPQQKLKEYQEFLVITQKRLNALQKEQKQTEEVIELQQDLDLVKVERKILDREFTEGNGKIEKQKIMDAANEENVKIFNKIRQCEEDVITFKNKVKKYERKIRKLSDHKKQATVDNANAILGIESRQNPSIRLSSSEAPSSPATVPASLPVAPVDTKLNASPPAMTPVTKLGPVVNTETICKAFTAGIAFFSKSLGKTTVQQAEAQIFLAKSEKAQATNYAKLELVCTLAKLAFRDSVIGVATFRGHWYFTVGALNAAIKNTLEEVKEPIHLNDPKSAEKVEENATAILTEIKAAKNTRIAKITRTLGF